MTADRLYNIDPEFSPTENLFYFLQDLESAYDEVWESADETTCQLVVELERIARDLLTSGVLFQPHGQISTVTLAERLIPFAEKDRSSLVSNDIANSAIEMALLKQTSTRIHLFCERLTQIVGVVRSLPFDGFTQRYLEEMSRLYLDGHDMAVYITARAALEESLKEIIEHLRLETELCRFAGQTQTRPLPSLDWIISFAVEQDRLIPKTLEKQATDLRLRGNWAVHQRERMAEAADNFPPIQAIKSLAAILKSLARWKK